MSNLDSLYRQGFLDASRLPIPVLPNGIKPGSKEAAIYRLGFRMSKKGKGVWLTS